MSIPRSDNDEQKVDPNQVMTEIIKGKHIECKVAEMEKGKQFSCGMDVTLHILNFLEPEQREKWFINCHTKRETTEEQLFNLICDTVNWKKVIHYLVSYGKITREGQDNKIYVIYWTTTSMQETVIGYRIHSIEKVAGVKKIKIEPVVRHYQNSFLRYQDSNEFEYDTQMEYFYKNRCYKQPFTR